MAKIYMIGNSLTDQVNYGGFQALAESRGNKQVWGRQMVPGAPLEYFVNNPTAGFQEAPFGAYENAFSYYRWDAITLQPFDRHLYDDAPLIGDITAIDALLQPLETLNSNAQIYIYAQYPLNNGLDWDTQWLRPYTGGWDDTQRTQAYYELLTNELNATEPLFSPFYMIPVGHVMYELNQRMEAGQVPGYTSITELYSDTIHLNNVGSYLVATTFYATIYQDNPIGLPVLPQYQQNSGIATDQPLTAALAAIIQDAVWDVVTTTPLSGVRATIPFAIRATGVLEAIADQTYTDTFEAIGGQGDYTWSLTAGALPTGLTLTPQGTLSGTPTTSGTFDFTVQVIDGGGSTLNQAYTLTVSPDSVPVITTTTLTDAARGSLYQETLVTTSGNGTKTWSVISGELPTGISLRSDGLLSGTPGIEGSYTFTVQATDSDATPDSDTQTLTLVVGAPTANTLLINKTLSPITIDGSLNESVWSLTQSTDRGAIGTPNNTVTFGALWDDTYLYVAAQVVDATLRTDSANLWNDDAIEIFIDANHDRQSVFNNDDRQIIVDSRGTLYEQGGRSSGIQRGVQTTANGYVVEVAIPWSNLGLTPTANLTIGFDLANDDDDNGGDRDSQLAWQTVNVLNLAPNQFGNLLLLGDTVGSTSGSTSSGSSGAGSSGAGSSGAGSSGAGTSGTGSTTGDRVTITFDNLTPGVYDSVYTDPSGYTFSDVVPLADYLRIYGSSTGYQSNVLHANNWGHTLQIARSDRGAFDLFSFDYANSVYNDTVDALVTGYFADGTTQTAQFATTSKQLQTLTLNWSNVTRVDVNFASGTNAAYGAIDNVVLGAANSGSTGGTSGSTSGNTSGGTSGGTSGDTTGSGSTGGTSGSTSGNTSGGTSGGTSGDTTGSGSTGGTSGSTSGGTSGDTTGSGSTGGTSGGTSGNTTGGTSGNTSGGTSGDTTGSGSTGGTSGNTSGGTSGDTTGSGSTGGTSGSTSGGTSGDTTGSGSTGGTSGGTSGNTTGGTSGNTSGGTSGDTTGSGSTGGTSNPRLAITFDSLTSGYTNNSVYADPSGYVFTNQIPFPDGFQVYGTSNGYQSNVLHANNWGQTIQIRKADNSTFDLTSFDYGASVYMDTVDATVTGYLANGSTRTASFLTSTKQLQTLNLDWADLTRAEINFAGGTNAAYGALDNFVVGVA